MFCHVLLSLSCSSISCAGQAGLNAVALSFELPKWSRVPSLPWLNFHNYSPWSELTRAYFSFSLSNVNPNNLNKSVMEWTDLAKSIWFVIQFSSTLLKWKKPSHLMKVPMYKLHADYILSRVRNLLSFTIGFNIRRLRDYKWGVNGIVHGLLTFLSGDSIIFHSLSFNWCSSSNFMLTSSIESCSKSQKPARSWEVGLGMALGSCHAQRREYE